MLHPLISTLVHRPDLVVEHVSAYAALLQAEASVASGQWVRRALAWALVAAGALLFVVFAGVALMLGLVMDRFHWALVAVPGAFTPTCTLNHLPGYLENRDALMARGVDDIAVVAVNDWHVMGAWAQHSGGMGKIHFLADWDASFTKALGLDSLLRPLLALAAFVPVLTALAILALPKQER